MEISDVIDKLDNEIILIPDYISIVGSMVKGGNSGDEDFLIKDDRKDNNLLFLISRALERAGVPLADQHFIFEPRGPHSTYYSLYHLVLRKTGVKRLIEEEEIKLNVGCGEDYQEGYINIDISPLVKADLHLDFERAVSDHYLPWENNSVDEILARHFIEHCENPIAVMNTFWELLKPTGKLHLIYPAVEGVGAFANPDHKAFWNSATISFFIQPNLARSIGARLWRLEKAEQTQRGGAVDVDCVLIPLKTASLQEAFKIGKPFIPPKMGAAYSFGEFFDIDLLYNNFVKPFFDRNIPVYVEPKWNGWRTILEGDGKGRAWVYFETTDYNRDKEFTKLAKDLGKFQVILDVDLGARYYDGHLVARKDLAFLSKKDVVVDEDALDIMGKKARLIAHAFDIIVWQGEDISQKPIEERKQALEEAVKMIGSPYIVVADYRPAKDKKTFYELIKWAAGFENSEGAVIKAFGSQYTEEEIPAWAKFKKFVEIKVKVKDKWPIKGSKNTFTYIVTYLSKSGEKELSKTMNTNVDADIGQIITLSVEEVIPIWNEELGEWQVSVVIPRVRDIDLSRVQPERAEEIIQRAYKGGILQISPDVEDRVKKLLEEEVPPEEGHGGTFAKDFEPFIEEGDEGEGVWQLHEMGLSEQQAKSPKMYPGESSLHNDFRLLNETKKNDFLIGFESGMVDISDPLQILKGKVLLMAGVKKPPPLIWMDVGMGKRIGNFTPGKVEIPELGMRPCDLVPPNSVGSTKYTWSRFTLIDRFKFKAGKQDKHFKEFFVKGKVLNGRLLLMAVPYKEGRVWNLRYIPEEEKEK